jgi:hypothetical protein
MEEQYQLQELKAVPITSASMIAGNISSGTISSGRY